MSLWNRLLLALTILKGVDRMIMVDIYVALFLAGRRTLDQVPATIRDAVAAELDALGIPRG